MDHIHVEERLRDLISTGVSPEEIRQALEGVESRPPPVPRSPEGINELRRMVGDLQSQVADLRRLQTTGAQQQTSMNPPISRGDPSRIPRISKQQQQESSLLDRARRRNTDNCRMVVKLHDVDAAAENRRLPAERQRDFINKTLARSNITTLQSIRVRTAEVLPSNDVELVLSTAAEAEVLRKHEAAWIRFYGTKAEVVKPSYPVVLHFVNVNEVKRTKDLPGKIYRENADLLEGNEIIYTKFSSTVPAGAAHASLIIDFSSPQIANTIIEKGLSLFGRLIHGQLYDKTARNLLCYNCSRWGHKANTCRAHTSTCGRCAQDGHSRKECPKTGPVCCSNCRGPHEAQDNVCPVKQAHIQQQRNRLINRPLRYPVPLAGTPSMTDPSSSGGSSNAPLISRGHAVASKSARHPQPPQIQPLFQDDVQQGEDPSPIAETLVDQLVIEEMNKQARINAKAVRRSRPPTRNPAPRTLVQEVRLEENLNSRPNETRGPLKRQRGTRISATRGPVPDIGSDQEGKPTKKRQTQPLAAVTDVEESNTTSSETTPLTGTSLDRGVIQINATPDAPGTSVAETSNSTSTTSSSNVTSSPDDLSERYSARGRRIRATQRARELKWPIGRDLSRPMGPVPAPTESYDGASTISRLEREFETDRDTRISEMTSEQTETANYARAVLGKPRKGCRGSE